MSGHSEDRWKTTRFRSDSAAVVLAWSDVVNAGFVLSTATLEMTPSLSMVSTLSDLPSTLCGPEAPCLGAVGLRRRIAVLSASKNAVGSLHEEVALPRKKSAGRRRTEPYSISAAEQLMSSFSAVRIPNNTNGSAVVQLTPVLCI
ncbi:hypothetical protein T07_8827 [Trichinella nelsoni]|uniref:Uncharacterized protein n=1 Tax=Trichinella nelsoni TaxID=6336 RepID=A0A0V0RFT8_9BILA|nr:hypothetical protein T07_8827 [Trichinella nelsoni]